MSTLCGPESDPQMSVVSDRTKRAPRGANNQVLVAERRQRVLPAEHGLEALILVASAVSLLPSDQERPCEWRLLQQ
jgi:hypothetical protein